MSNRTSVTFSDGETTTFPESVKVSIGEHGVLVIDDGQDVRVLAPHAWVELRERRRAGEVWGF